FGERFVFYRRVDFGGGRISRRRAARAGVVGLVAGLESGDLFFLSHAESFSRALFVRVDSFRERRVGAGFCLVEKFGAVGARGLGWGGNLDFDVGVFAAVTAVVSK